MSVFKVKLQNIKQGLLDLDPSTHPLATGDPASYGVLGNSFTASKQRQIFVAGPKRKYRLLKDGDQFTDCNYWKQFAYPQVALEFAFIEVVTDDGSVYSEVESENTFAKGATVTLTTSLADTVVDFVATYGGTAKMLMVQNLDNSATVTGELNGDTNVTFTLAHNETQIFNNGDLAITKLRLKSTGTTQASWLASIKSVPTS
jgi:hypothetical protein